MSSPEIYEKGSTHCTASRKPDMALMSLPSVALSSISVKQSKYNIEGVNEHPKKSKLSLTWGTL